MRTDHDPGDEHDDARSPTDRMHKASPARTRRARDFASDTRPYTRSGVSLCGLLEPARNLTRVTAFVDCRDCLEILR